MFVVINITGVLSVTDRDDDYYVSYTVTAVDVRRCTRPPRLKSASYIGNIRMYNYKICIFYAVVYPNNLCIYTHIYEIHTYHNVYYDGAGMFKMRWCVYSSLSIPGILSGTCN